MAFNPFLAPFLAAAFLAPLPALAIDLDALSTPNRKLACVAYVAIQIETLHEAGAIPPSVYERDRANLISKIYSKGDNYSYAADLRRFERYMDQILAERPDRAEFLADVAACRRTLRM